MTVPASAGTDPRVLVSAGEVSGDEHAAAVIAELASKVPTCDFRGLGGCHMAAAGATISARLEHFSTMGFTSAIRMLPAHYRLLSRMRRDLKDGGFSLALLTDYPGFHLRVAREATRFQVPVLYYIAPQLWAWGERRIDRLRQSVTHLAVILPFEEGFFRERGVTTTFVGHPLLDRVWPTRDEARSSVRLTDSNPVLGLFPGSRGSDVRQMWPTMREAALRVRLAEPEVEVLVAAMPDLAYAGADEFRLVRDDSPTVMAASDAVLCKSGTATLEAALSDTPLAICYKTDVVSYAIAKRLVRCRYVGLVNLVAGREVVPEYIQASATPEALARAMLPLLERSGPAAHGQREAFAEVRSGLGTPGAAGRVADIASELMPC